MVVVGRSRCSFSPSRTLGKRVLDLSGRGALAPHPLCPCLRTDFLGHTHLGSVGSGVCPQHATLGTSMVKQHDHGRILGPTIPTRAP